MPNYVKVIIVFVFMGGGISCDIESEGQELFVPQEVSRGDGPSNNFLAIGRLYRELNGPGMCSGVLVEPDVVLTAAHCSDIKGVRFRNTSRMFRVVDSLSYPTYNLDPQAYSQSYKDVQFLLLDQPVGLVPMRIAESIPESPPWNGVASPKHYLTVTGWGTGDATAPEGAQSGIFRTGKTSNWNLGRSNNEFALYYGGATICPGDSGGPLLNSDGEIIGINSAGTRLYLVQPCSESTGTVTAITPGSAARLWLDQGVIKKVNNKTVLNHELVGAREPSHIIGYALNSAVYTNDFNGDGCRDTLNWDKKSPRAITVKHSCGATKTYTLPAKPISFYALEVDGNKGIEMIVMHNDKVTVLSDAAGSIHSASFLYNNLQILGGFNSKVYFKTYRKLTTLSITGSITTTELPHDSVFMQMANFTGTQDVEPLFYGNYTFFSVDGNRVIEILKEKGDIAIVGVKDVSGNGYDDAVFNVNGDIIVALGKPALPAVAPRAVALGSHFSGSSSILGVVDTNGDGSREIVFKGVRGYQNYYVGSLQVSPSGATNIRFQSIVGKGMLFTGLRNIDGIPGVEATFDVGNYSPLYNEMGYVPSPGLNPFCNISVANGVLSWTIEQSSTCSYTYDGVPGVLECKSGSLLLSDLQSGSHAVTLAVSTAEGGSMTCSKTVVVENEVSPPSIEEVRARPAGGPGECAILQEGNEIHWIFANARMANCYYIANGGKKTSFGCGEGRLPISAYPPGNNSLTLGFSGLTASANTCSVSFVNNL